MLLFLAFFVAFAIKVPLFPLHTWLPDAHVEAPTAGSVMLAGVMLKMGTYGMLRFCLPLFPNAAHRAAPWIAALAIIGIIYGALVALVQPNMKKLVAYSSVSHLGFVVLGIFSFRNRSMQGAVYQMLNHGISTGALFLLVGMLYERRHSLEITEYGGVATPMPKLATVFLFVALASHRPADAQQLRRRIPGPARHRPAPRQLGQLGRHRRDPLRLLHALGLPARLLRRTSPSKKIARYQTLQHREIGILVTMAVITLWMGIGSTFFTHRFAASSQNVLDQMQRSNPQEAATLAQADLACRRRQRRRNQVRHGTESTTAASVLPSEASDPLMPAVESGKHFPRKAGTR